MFQTMSFDLDLPDLEGSSASFSTSSVSCSLDMMDVDEAEADSPIIKRQRQGVRFNEGANRYHYGTASYSSTWYSEPELKQFKAEYTQEIKEVIRIELARVEELQAKENKKKVKKTYLKVLTRVYQACCNNAPISSKDMAYFHQWVSGTRGGSNDACRVGLERLVVRRIRQDKAMRKQEMTCAILEAQHDQLHQQQQQDAYLALYEGNRDDKDDDKTKTSKNHADALYQQELLAQVSLEISEPSRRFAQLLAQAQWQGDAANSSCDSSSDE